MTNRPPLMHSLKSWPEYFRLHFTGELEMSIRLNDRDYQPGDICQFFEWDHARGFTGRKSLHYRIRYILQKSEGLKDGYVVLLLEGPYGGGRVTLQEPQAAIAKAEG